MAVDTLTTDKFYAQLHIPLDPLLSAKPFYKDVQHYLIACQVESKTKKTIRAYASVLNAFLDFNNNKKPTRDDIREFLYHIQCKTNNRGKPVSIHTQHMYHRSLKTFFTWMVNENIIKSSPMDKMKAPKLPKYVITPLSQDDIDHLLLCVAGDRFTDYRNRALILLFLDTCVRNDEGAKIKLEHIDMVTGRVKVFGKGNKERYVKMGKNTQKALLTYMAKRNDNYDCLWISEERKPLSAPGVTIQIRRLLKQAEVHSSKRGPHILRHTGAIMFLRNGGDISSLQIMLGHSDLTMTRKYLSSLGTDDMIKAHLQASPVDNLFKKK